MRNFLGSEILAKRDFFGSMKDAGIFWGGRKKQGFFFTFHQLKSTMLNISVIHC